MITVTSFSKPVFKLPCPPIGTVQAHICRKKCWDEMIMYLETGIGDPLPVLKEISGGAETGLAGVTGAAVFLRSYRSAVEEYTQRNMDIFAVPSKADFDTENGNKHIRLPIVTWGEKLVHDHTGLSFLQIGELDLLDYRMLLADAVKLLILRNNPDGEDYLNDCYDYMHRISNLFG